MTDTQQLGATLTEVQELQAKIQGKDVYELLAFLYCITEKHLGWLNALTEDNEKLKQEIKELKCSKEVKNDKE